MTSILHMSSHHIVILCLLMLAENIIFTEEEYKERIAELSKKVIELVRGPFTPKAILNIAINIITFFWFQVIFVQPLVSLLFGVNRPLCFP